MKTTLLLLLAAFSLSALGQSSVYNATTYAYTTQVTSGNTSTGSSSIRANPTAFAQGMPFLPYNTNAPITINRNAATAETLTPSAIANCYPNSLTCTLAGAFTFKHISGENIQSGTFGLQEALNIAVAAGSGTVLIDSSWQGPSGSSLITAATGNSNVMIQDNRNPSGATFYQCSGNPCIYAATGGGGGSLPSAPGYGYVPVSTGAGTTYSAQTTLLGFGANGVQYIQQPLGSNFYPTVGINFLNKVFEVDGFSSYGGVGRAVSAFTGASDVPVCSVISNSGLFYIAVASNNHGTTPGTNAAIWYLVPNNLPATASDCAAYMANSYTRSQNSGSIVQFGSGSYSMNQGFVYQETGSSFGDEFSVQFAGSGQGVTYLSYAGTAGVVWFSRPNGAANFSSLSIHDMTLDGGGLASSIMDLDTLNQSYFYHLSMGHIQPGSDHVAKFAHTGGFGFQVFLNEINVGVFPDTNVPNCAQITASGTTTISFTVSNGGTCYRTPTASLVAHTQLRGTQAGTAAFPCTVMPTGGGVPTFSGNALTSITPMTGATGCVGPYYVQVYESVPYAHGIVMNESDSSANDITSYVGDTSAFQINAGNFVGVHLHPSVVPNGIEWNASGQLVGTEIDDVFDKAFILNQPFSTTGVSITGTNGYVGCGGSSRINVGASMYYFAATTVNANIGDSASLFDFGGTNSTCNAGWTPFLTQSGPITNQATLLAKAPAGFSVTGQDKSLSQTTAIGDYIPLLAVANLDVTTCTGCGSAGVSSLNTQTGAQIIVGDSSITVTPNGTNQVALHVNGSAGSGAVTSSPLQAIGGFQASGTTIANAPNLYFVTPSNTQAQVNSLLAGLSGSNTYIIPAGTPQALYSTNNQIPWDTRLGASYFQMPGIACDAKQLPFAMTITSGSNTSTAGSFTTADIGKTFFFTNKSGFGFGFTQSVWAATLSGVSGTTLTWSANAPFSQTAQVYYGTDNLATVTAAMSQANSTFPLTIPTGCQILVNGTIAWNNSQVIVGRHMNSGGFVGRPGLDVIATTDTSGQSISTPGVGLANFAIIVGSEIDATFPWNYYAPNGTLTVIQPLYRPAQPHTPNANNPCAPGWMIGCTVGVGSITATSTSMTVPAGVTLPLNGSTIVFPYLTKVFTTTITGVNSGTRVVTLNAAAPAGSTQTQAEWFAGSSAQSTTTTISGTPTYPFTLQLSNSIAPIPGRTSNFSQWGHAKIQDYEFDYMGANPANNTIVVRRGPATVNGGSGYSGTNTIVALNPCPSNFDTPWPVTPTINAGDSTPTGANWFPAQCVGNAGIAFPQANGNVFVGTGLVNGYLEKLQFLASSVQSTNNVAQIYIAGNNAPFSSLFSDIQGQGFQYGFAGGPASYGMHGVASVGPTGIGNTFNNIHLFDAFPMSFVDMQGSTLDGLNLNSTMINPYDGTAIGSATCLQEGFALDEQTGGRVTTTQFNTHHAYACEPENGSHIIVPNAVIIDSQHATFDTANFEGIPNYFAGDHLKLINSTLSLPTIDDGVDNDYGTISNVGAFYSTNVWNSIPEFYNWGINATCSATVGTLSGPAVPCGPRFVQGGSGRSISNSVTNTKEENPEGGKITPGEWNTNGAFDSGPMSVNNVIDPTEPYWGSYGGCNLNTGAAQCQPESFDGFNGYIYIGTHQRIADQPYLAVFDLKSAAAGGQVTVQLSAFDSGTGQCASQGSLASGTFTTTTSWPDLSHPYVLPVDFTGHAGCILQIHFFNATTTDQYRVGYFNFVPVQPSDTVASSTTPVFSIASKVSNMTLTASVTSFTLPAGYDSQPKTICWKQGSGSYTVTAPSNVHGFFTLGLVNGNFNCQSYVYNTASSLWLATTPGVINE